MSSLIWVYKRYATFGGIFLWENHIVQILRQLTKFFRASEFFFFFYGIVGSSKDETCFKLVPFKFMLSN